MNEFITARAADQNWRGVVKGLVTSLSPKIDAAKKPPNLGLLYITDKLSRDAQSIVELLRSITSVPFWVGVTGSAILSDAGVYADRPAASCLLMHVAADDFAVIGASQENYQADLARIADSHKALGAQTAHVYLHPETGYPPQMALTNLYEQTMCFMTGGLSSARGAHNVFSHNKKDDMLSGCFFSQNIPLVSALFEGFSAMGAEHKITSCQKNAIFELDGKSAANVLADDLSSWLSTRLAGEEDYAGQRLDALMAYLPEMPAEIQMAFRYYNNDITGRSVKALSGCSEDKGWVSAAHVAAEGEYVSFVIRDSAALKMDLAKKLMALRSRLQAEGTLGSIKGGVYISNASRLDPADTQIELTLIKEIIGDIPLAGFYSSGEISHHSLYNFTAQITLFV
jgi:small ligand-binding sensory domain FIST